MRICQKVMLDKIEIITPRNHTLYLEMEILGHEPGFFFGRIYDD